MKTVIGLFDDFSAAESAVASLTQHNIDRGAISVAGHNVGADQRGVPADVQQSDTRKQAMQDGAIAGAGTGAAIGTGVGGVLGLLAGLGTIFIPGIGPLIAAGPLVATLTGAGVGAAAGAAVGSLVGALTQVGVPEHDAHFYAEAVRRGGSLVIVRADDDRVDDIADVLSEHGAVDVDKRRENFEQRGIKTHDASQEPFTPAQIAEERAAYGTAAATSIPRTSVQQPRIVDQAAVTVPVVEEELKVGKRLVERGGIRVYAHVTETPVQEQVTLREQHATVERRTVDRPISPADATAFKEQTFEVREFAEQAVVAKEARVVEEVTVGRKVEDHTEIVRDTVRRSDVEVEEVEEVNVDDLDARTTNPFGVPRPPPTRKTAS